MKYASKLKQFCNHIPRSSNFCYKMMVNYEQLKIYYTITIEPITIHSAWFLFHRGKNHADSLSSSPLRLKKMAPCFQRSCKIRKKRKRVHLSCRRAPERMNLHGDASSAGKSGALLHLNLLLMFPPSLCSCKETERRVQFSESS